MSANTQTAKCIANLDDYLALVAERDALAAMRRNEERILADYARIQNEAENLRSALTFYANPDHYCQLTIIGVPYSDPRTFAPVLQDTGRLARCALEWALSRSGGEWADK